MGNTVTMKLVHVIHSLAPSTGGTAEAVRLLTRELGKLGCHNEIVCLDDPESEWFGRFDVPVTGAGPSANPLGYSRRLLQAITECAADADALLAHGTWLYPSTATRKAARRLGKPYFIYPHGMLDPYFLQLSRLREWRNRLYWMLVEHKNLHGAAGVCFTCAEEQRLASEAYHPFKAKGAVVGLGIENWPAGQTERAAATRAFQERWPHLRDIPFLLFISRLHPKKGLENLIDAYRETYGAAPATAGDSDKPQGSPVSMSDDSDSNGDIPNPPLLFIAGTAHDPDYEQALKERAHDLGDRVIWAGFLDGPAKLGAFLSAEAFVLPSHQENFGIAVAEALAAGLPVLISRKVNIWKEIQDEDAGICAADDLPGCRELLVQWREASAERRAELSGNAIRCFHTFFESRAAAGKLKELIARETGCLTPE